MLTNFETRADIKYKKKLQRTLSGDFHKHVRIKHCGSNPEDKLHKHPFCDHIPQKSIYSTVKDGGGPAQRHCTCCSNGSPLVAMPASRRVAHLREQYGKAKAVTLSSFEHITFEHSRHERPDQSPLKEGNSCLTKQTASTKRDQFKRRKAMTIGDPDHEYLMRSSDKLTAIPSKKKVLAKRLVRD